MAKNKKPTIKELAEVCRHLVISSEQQEIKLSQMDRLFAAFIHFMKQDKLFKAWLQEQSKEKAEEVLEEKMEEQKKESKKKEA